jgi:formate hydrogenlyase subunit 4
MSLALNILQLLLLAGSAPLVRGFVALLKARLQNRRGASVWRPYADLLKLFQKEELVPPTASALFRLCPMVLFAATVTAAAFLPVLYGSALLGTRGDFILLVYVLALGRFFLTLGAMDGGSSFGGMGASRDALVSTLAEAPLLLALTATAILARTGALADIVQWTITQDLFRISGAHAVAGVALVMVAIAEAGRVPVDNPATHLELTMIHEAMVLEYSGPSLALIEWASALKLSVLVALLINLFVPWGIAATVSAGGLALGLVSYAGKVAVVAAGLAVLESGVAKMRMYLVPNFLGVASALAVLAVVFAVIMR